MKAKEILEKQRRDILSGKDPTAGCYNMYAAAGDVQDAEGARN